MPVTYPDRLRWAVDTLCVQPDDRLLEIGCGVGLAVSLICERLTTGSIIALDRSETMIRLAARRNAQHVEAGRAAFQARPLAKASLGSARFDKVFSVNVSLFWTHGSAELALLKRHLAPGGAVYVFHQPPDPTKTRPSAEQAAALFRAGGYAVTDLFFHDIKLVEAACIIGQPLS